jgi:hypothetical protein
MTDHPPVAGFKLPAESDCIIYRVSSSHLQFVTAVKRLIHLDSEERCFSNLPAPGGQHSPTAD